MLQTQTTTTGQNKPYLLTKNLFARIKNNKLFVSFLLRTRKGVNIGIVYYKVSVNRKSTREKSTGIRVLSENWDKKRQIIINNESENKTLSILKSTIRDTYNSLLLDNEFATPDFLMENHFSKFGQVGLYEICEKYMVKLTKRNNLQNSTIKGYKGVLKKVKKFFTLKNKEFVDIPVMQFKPALADDFFSFLRKTQGQNHAVMHVEFVRRSIDYGMSILKVIDHNPISAYKPKKETIFKNNHLSINELIKLENANFDNKKYQDAADMFLFQCYTGLAYVDMCRFSAKKHLQFLGGKMWIMITRQKVKNSTCEIPLFKKTDKILNKHDYNLPFMSLGKYNRILRDIQKMCNIVSIDKMTSHSGRKTLGNMVLEKGGSLEIVSKMYGHASLKTTQKYYNKISRDRVAREIEAIGFSW